MIHMQRCSVNISLDDPNPAGGSNIRRMHFRPVSINSIAGGFHRAPKSVLPDLEDSAGLLQGICSNSPDDLAVHPAARKDPELSPDRRPCQMPLPKRAL